MLTHDNIRNALLVHSFTLAPLTPSSFIFAFERSDNKKTNFEIHAPYFDTDQFEQKIGFLNCLEMSKDSILNVLQEIETLKPEFSWQRSRREDFEDDFVQIKQRIERKERLKLVAYSESLCKKEIQRKEILYLLKNALACHNELYPYAFVLENEGMIGLSPEILWQKQGKEIFSYALAGSATVDRAQEEFLQDPKENKEHQWVIQDILERTQNLADAEKGKTEVVNFGNIQHLRTKISFKNAKSTKLYDWLKVLHPTAALGGYPSFHVLKELRQQKSRQHVFRHGAPFAYEWKDQAISLVAIRNLQWVENMCILASGCGIVQESQIDKEWQELQLKKNSILEYLL